MFVPLNAIHWTDCKIHHNLKPLKYRHLLLGEHFGNFKFQTKTHSGIIPADLEKTGKELLISNELGYIRSQYYLYANNRHRQAQFVHCSLKKENVLLKFLAAFEAC